MTSVAPASRLDPAPRDGATVSPRQTELSIVIPSLNEAETLGACLSKAQESLDRLGIVGELIVADNGSTDASVELAMSHDARVVHVGERGYGCALAAGIADAAGEYVIMGDADDSYDFSQLEPFVEKLREGYELVVGNRFRGGIQPGAMPFLHRVLGNPVLSWLARHIFGSPCGDVYCGLRGFRRDAIQRLALRSPGMEYAIEMLVKASFYGLKTTEVPTTLSRDGRTRPPHLRTWRDGWRSLRFMLLYSPNWLFLYPGLVLMALGAAGIVWLLPGPREVLGVHLDVHTMAYLGIAVMVGFQSVLFSAFAKVFGITEGLLPAHFRTTRLLRHVTLEVGLGVGAVLLVCGLAGALYSVGVWQSHSFGRLEYAETMRVVLPSGLLIALGCQTILASFFLSILGLRRQCSPTDDQPASRSGAPAGGPRGPQLGTTPTKAAVRSGEARRPPTEARPE